MSRGFARPSVVLAALGFALFGRVGLPQADTPGGAPPTVQGETVQVRAVNVEVTVTDREGKAVRGLGRQEFELFVDGKRVSIDYFSEVADGLALQGAADSEADPNADPKASPDAEKPELAGRNFLIAIDDLFAIGAPRDAILKRLAADLSLLGPADRVAVVSYRGDRIEILSPWTGDGAQIGAALARAIEQRPFGNRTLAAHRRIEEDAQWKREAAAALDDEDPRLSQLEVGLEEMVNRVSPEARTAVGKAADAFARALRGVDAPPGRKVLLMISGAWSMQVDTAVFAPLLAAADRLGYSIYPIDAASSDALAFQGFDDLARATGGRFLRPADLHILRAIERETRSYYLLGFVPTGEIDGKSHTLQVLVTRPALLARSRHAFREGAPHHDAAEKALLTGGDPERQRLVVELGPPIRSERGVAIVATLGVPVDLLLEGRPPGPQRIDLPLAISIEDLAGRRAARSDSHLALELPDGFRAAPGSLVRFRTTIELRDVPQTLVFVVGGLLGPAANGTIWGRTDYRPAEDATP